MHAYEHEWSAPLFSEEMLEAEPEKCRRLFELLKAHLRKAWKDRTKNKQNRYYNEKFFDSEPINGIERESNDYVEFNDEAFMVKAHNYVGYISVGEINLTILPKYLKPLMEEQTNDQDEKEAGLQELLYILKYAFNLQSSYKDVATIGHETNSEILEFIIRIFSSEAYSLLKRHQYRRYEGISENLTMVKGKIQFSEQLKENIVKSRLERMHCLFDVFTEDNTFNRLVKYVSKKLISVSRDEVNKKNLRAILNLLVDVKDEIVTKTTADRISLTRLEADLNPILSWCKFFLNKGLLHSRKNKSEVHSILMNMDRVFEAFVGRFLQRNISTFHFATQSSQDYLASTPEGENVFQMRYDILGIRDEKKVIIDAKNKITDFSNSDRKGGVSQSDLYQMSSYAIRKKCKNILLVYPKQVGGSGRDSLDFLVKDEFDENEEKIKIRCKQIRISDSDKEDWEVRDQRLIKIFQEVLPV